MAGIVKNPFKQFVHQIYRRRLLCRAHTTMATTADRLKVCESLHR
jgi:hypothetical protein